MQHTYACFSVVVQADVGGDSMGCPLAVPSMQVQQVAVTKVVVGADVRSMNESSFAAHADELVLVASAVAAAVGTVGTARGIH